MNRPDERELIIARIRKLAGDLTDDDLRRVEIVLRAKGGRAASWRRRKRAAKQGR